MSEDHDHGEMKLLTHDDIYQQMVTSLTYQSEHNLLLIPMMKLQGACEHVIGAAEHNAKIMSEAAQKISLLIGSDGSKH